MVPTVVIEARGSLRVPHPADVDAVDDTTVVGHVNLFVVVVAGSGGGILKPEDLAPGIRACFDPHLLADLRGCAGGRLGRDETVLTAVHCDPCTGLDTCTLQQADTGSIGSLGLGAEGGVLCRGTRCLIQTPVQVGTLCEHLRSVGIGRGDWNRDDSAR